MSHRDLPHSALLNTRATDCDIGPPVPL